MGYATPEQTTQAREWDLLTYLQRYDPHQLVHVGGSTYCTREHDSLKTSNEKWSWFSRKTGGKTVLDYLIKAQGFSSTGAVEALTGPNPSPLPPAFQARPKEQESRKLILPQSSRRATRVVNYLHGRGIDYDMIDYYIQTGRLYGSLPYHNAVLVGRDRQGQPHYAALRGIIGGLKGEATGSDKRYFFAIVEDSTAPSVHLFESAIDLLSYAILPKMKGRDWRQDAMLSLGGVLKQKQEFVIPMALSQYLQDHLGVHTFCLHLDNDEAGQDAAASTMTGLGDRYEVLDRPPPSGKDVNDLLLQRRLGQAKRKEEWSRWKTIRVRRSSGQTMVMATSGPQTTAFPWG